MLTVEDVKVVMMIVIPIVLAVVIVGFLTFVRWGVRDKEKNRLKPPKGLT